MRLIRLDSTDSTNTQAFQYLDKFDPVAVIAKTQISGRGRGENRWESPPGNIYLSVGKTLDTRFLAGLSVRVAIHVLLKLNPLLKSEKLRIKWPNDLYLHDKKAGGILVESKITATVARVAAGIGLNLRNAPLESATTIGEMAIPDSKTVEQFVVEAILAALSDEGSAGLVEQLHALSWFKIGEKVRFIEHGAPVSGSFEGYDDSLAMIVRMGNRSRAIIASEVSRLQKATH